MWQIPQQQVMDIKNQDHSQIPLLFKRRLTEVPGLLVVSPFSMLPLEEIDVEL
jgi:hypothetical protein